MRKYRPLTGLFAAALIVFVQLVGAAHFHNFTDSRHAAQTQLSADSELCSVCLMAFHAPAAASPALAHFSAVVEIGFVSSTATVGFSRVSFEDHLGRAPPASL